MNAYDLFRAVGEVGGDLVEEAAAEAKKRRRAPMYAAALAACAALMLLLARPWAQETPAVTSAPAVEEQPGAQETPAASAPAAEEQPGAEETPAVATAPVAMDMVAFVIYGGRMYECSQVLEGDAAEELMGEYLFTSPGYIDEWSSPEEYTDGTGSVAGDVYTVKGYDSAFRLCIPLDGGALLELYDTLDGITLRTGEDLYGERLHLRENWREAEYQTHDDWNSNEDTFRTPELTEEEIAAFIDALYAGEFEYWGPDSETGDIFTGDIYGLGLEQKHLYFRLADGSSVELRLFENGLVKYTPLPDRVLVDASGAAFDAVWAACG